MSSFFSMQYSAIQKTVLRHNRLWSIAGISQGLSRLNEIVFTAEAQRYGGTVMVAGGGKFTAFFPSPRAAESAQSAIIEKLVTGFPMLEFQASDIEEADNFIQAKEKNIIDGLNDQKRRFRGYATTFLPHLEVCDECGEYPAERSFGSKSPGKSTYWCRTCHEAWWLARIDLAELRSEKGLTSLERIYAEYFKLTPPPSELKAVYDFDDLFPGGKGAGSDSKNRMAVWFSDLNNMNQKVPIWLSMPDEKVFETFETVKEVNIAVVATALSQTFPTPAGKMPFRLIVAGGDDLCLVMPEEYVLDFASALDAAVRDKIEQLNRDSSNPLNPEWLKQMRNEWAKKNPENSGDPEVTEIGPYSFGASFVITPTHTPFNRIHELGEELMKTAKEKTGRRGNSINWRIMAEEQAVSDSLLDFERPLFINSKENKNAGFNELSLDDYLDLRRKFTNISASHRYAIITKLIELRQQEAEEQFEDWLKCYDSGEVDKSFSDLLRESRLRCDNTSSGKLVPARVATLFELLGIKDRKN